MKVLCEKEDEGIHEQDTWGVVVILREWYWVSDIEAGGSSEGKYEESTLASTVHVV